MGKRGRDSEDQFRILRRVFGKKGGRASVKLQMSEPESEGADGIVILVIPLPLPAPS